jgi:hypothetical protein
MLLLIRINISFGIAAVVGCGFVIRIINFAWHFLKIIYIVNLHLFWRNKFILIGKFNLWERAFWKKCSSQVFLGGWWCFNHSKLQVEI